MEPRTVDQRSGSKGAPWHFSRSVAGAPDPHREPKACRRGGSRFLVSRFALPVGRECPRALRRWQERTREIKKTVARRCHFTWRTERPEVVGPLRGFASCAQHAHGANGACSFRGRGGIMWRDERGVNRYSKWDSGETLMRRWKRRVRDDGVIGWWATACAPLLHHPQTPRRSGPRPGGEAGRRRRSSPSPSWTPPRSSRRAAPRSPWR